MADPPLMPYAAVTAPRWKLVVRWKWLTAAIVSLVVGLAGYVAFGLNFTMLPQDADLMSPAQAAAWNARVEASQPWLTFGCAAMPFGLIGMVLLLFFSFRLRRSARSILPEESIGF